MKDSSIVANTIIIEEDNKNPGFEVEVTNNLVVLVPKGTLTQQIQYIAKRATQPPYGGIVFDFVFFDKAVAILETLPPKEKNGASLIEMLKIWRNCLSPGGITILKEQFVRFVRQAEEDYEIKVSSLFSSDVYDVIQLGSVQFQIIKESYGSGKKKVEIPQNSYHMIAMKQPLH